MLKVDAKRADLQNGYHQEFLISTVKKNCEVVRVSTVFGAD